MNNFNFQNPVRLVFGKGSIKKLSSLVPANAKTLLLYGGGSIKANGVYNQIQEAMRQHKLLEFGGIEPNPVYETCMQAVELIKKEKVEWILAVGGGSVADAAKFIALASCMESADAWGLIIESKRYPAQALPIAVVLTLPATGSEMNPSFVLTRRETQEKLSGGSPLVYPQFSILDPETTYSLPERQTVNGIVDAYVHVLETYLTIDLNTQVQDQWAEGILRVLIKNAPLVLQSPQNYALRETIMYAATMALNGYIGLGGVSDWATHRIGHELTAFYGIDHGRSLSAVNGSVLRYRAERKKAKLLMYAQRVWNLSAGNESQCIESAIQKTEEFYKNLGAPVSLSQAGIPDEAIEKVSARFQQRANKIGENGEIDWQDVRNILQKAR